MKPKFFRISLVLLLLTGLSLLAVPDIFAEALKSDSFVITFGNFNVTSGEKSSSSYNVTDTVGQTGAGPYGEYGSSTYFVGSGFQYIYQIDQFSFEISKNLIALGELEPLNHSTDSHTLKITTRGAGGYTVYAYETHPLRQAQGSEEIPDTTCNAGTCNHTAAAVWDDTSVEGFGYNMSGNDIPAGFIDSDYFKSFADNENGDTMQPVMSSSNVANDREATVTYKAGVGNIQASGNYETAVIFVAVPGF